ncbi:MAG: hypothetical protein P0Y56_12705 [Candidatus Andeanibacterium colombiense]|uniref:Uncharacterized protein n=1 Tax=Candidatus Andeanibacterium colombiense TaxID=3121345 RepID=A0AAJ6BND9_9SPHN|nr:MAG: hypothetical protein P0Y56_12705 [Sphingomonadaceae bacterium]
MPDITRDSDAILDAARKSLTVQREGGFHRRKGSLSIGKGSAEIKAKHAANKVARIVAATAAILVAAMVVGLVIDGIGFAGVMLTGVAIVAAVFGLGLFPRLKVPKRADLNRGDTRQLVGRTELWLENQRPALPAPAITLVDQIGVQLDALGVQLQHVDPAHPATGEIRQLVGETLPEMVDAYRRIPPHLRKEANAGKTPDEQLAESLGKISTEIDSVTRQLASGALDDLAIKTRYLDYKYGSEDVRAEGS